MATAGTVLRAVTALEEKLRASLATPGRNVVAPYLHASDDTGGPVSGTKDGGSLGSPNSVLRHAFDAALYAATSPASSASASPGDLSLSSDLDGLYGGADTAAGEAQPPSYGHLLRTPGLTASTPSQVPAQDGGLVAHHLRRADALVRASPPQPRVCRPRRSYLGPRNNTLLPCAPPPRTAPRGARDQGPGAAAPAGGLQLEGGGGGADQRAQGAAPLSLCRCQHCPPILVPTNAPDPAVPPQTERALLDAQLAANANAQTALSAMAASLHEVDPSCAVAIHLARLSVLDTAAVELTSTRAQLRVLSEEQLSKNATKRAGLRSTLNALVPGLDVGAVLTTGADDTHAAGHHSTEQHHHHAAPASTQFVESNQQHRGGIFTWLAAQLPGVIAGACGVMLASALVGRSRVGSARRGAAERHSQSAREAALSACPPQQLLDQGFTRVAVTHGGHAIFNTGAEHQEGALDSGFHKVALSAAREHPIFA